MLLDLYPPQVTQTTQPVPSPHHADAPPTGPSLSQLAPEQKFEQLKAEGNEHVKKVFHSNSLWTKYFHFCVLYITIGRICGSAELLLFVRQCLPKPSCGLHQQGSLPPQAEECKGASTDCDLHVAVYGSNIEYSSMKVLFLLSIPTAPQC